MTDVHSKSTRSWNMSRIRSKNTLPELKVRKFLFANGFRYRLYASNLPGKPDIVLAKYRTIIFVNGCFWHGHQNCSKATIPKSNTKYWMDKIARNKIKDKSAYIASKNNGWKVIVLWQCSLSQSLNPNLIAKIKKG
jgi:DNA mismatch endonuclease, patch repair protein